MRPAFVLLVLLTLAGSAGAETQDAAPNPPAASTDYSEKLDVLFGKLHGSADPAEAKQTEQEIWLIWSQNGAPEAMALLGEASLAMQVGDIDSAEQKLVKLVNAYPDFAEGWNRRATLYFMQGRYAESLADIARVLELEPRHFGALSGKGMILLAQGKKADALKAMKDALAINPYMAGVKANMEALEKLQPEL
jgi:tetratricopeptide (TPR) repeat protein